MGRSYSRQSTNLNLGIGNLLVVVVGAASALLMAWDIGIPYYCLFGISCLCLFYLSLANTTAAICLFMFLCPLMFLVRNLAPNDIVLAGVTSIWVFILTLGWGVLLLQGRARFPSGPDVTALGVFVAYAFVMAMISVSVLDIFLGLRSLVVPIAVFFIVRGVVAQKPSAGYPILISILISTAIMAIISYAWYMEYLKLGKLFSEGIIAGGGGRFVLGHYFERMDSLIGGGPSNVGIFFGVGTIICMALEVGKRIPLWKKAIFLVLGMIAAYAAFLSLSRSTIVLIMVSLMALLLSATTYKTAKVLMLSAVGVLTVGVVFGTSFSNATLLTVISRDAIQWIQAIPTDFGMIVGNGLTASGGNLVGGQQATIFIDDGWPGIWRMLGLPGALSILTFCWLLVYNYYRLAKTRTINPKCYATGIIAGIAALGLLFGSAHTAIIIRPVTCMVFYTLAAIMFSIYASSRNTTPSLARKV